MKKVAIFITLLLALPALAVDFEKTINDGKGDVQDADIDIVKVWTEKSGDDLVFCMQVNGKIRKIGSYSYSFTAQSGTSTVIVAFASGIAYYQSGTSAEYNIKYSIDGNTLKIHVPYSLFSSWQSFSLMAMASNGMNQDFVYEGYYGGNNEGSGGSDTTKTNDPTKEQPTDKSIEVKITKIVYDIKKVDNGQSWEVYLLVEGTTNGVDHVSLTYVTYYTDGTYDWADWMKGPINVPPYSGYGVELRKFFFNSTEGNWNKWKFELDAKYPVTQYKEYEWAERKDVKKVRVYARAYKDKEETKWNQAYYDTVPKMLSNGVSYTKTISTGSETESEGKKKTPGFELIAFAVAIAVVFAYKRKR